MNEALAYNLCFPQWNRKYVMICVVDTIYFDWSRIRPSNEQAHIPRHWGNRQRHRCHLKLNHECIVLILSYNLASPGADLTLQHL